ncbi:MAG: hypothetical protein U0W24_22060 [Bacteroidales bacterium]
MRFGKLLIIALLIIINTGRINSQKIHVKPENQVSTFTTFNFGDTLRYRFGGRYIPMLSIIDTLKNSQRIDLEASLNLNGNIFFKGNEFDKTEGEIKPYRLWLRYSSKRMEIRAGLQKINFGSASIFRPLMWFDKMDYRDPLQLTDGVYGLLGRYYFQNNANIWLWTLYGNDDPMGWDPVPSVKTIPEYGGRVQYPIPRGEIAFSYHHRKADYSELYQSVPMPGNTEFTENKIGLDGKWDLGVGLWFETVLKHNDPDNLLKNEWETYLNFGMDYTFQWGNGLNVITEYFRYDSRKDFSTVEIKNTYTALSLNYQFGLINTITAAVYYNWEPGNWSEFVSLQRKYDYWSFYLMAYSNPENYALSTTGEVNLFAGKGIQFMAVVNF